MASHLAELSQPRRRPPHRIHAFRAADAAEVRATPVLVEWNQTAGPFEPGSIPAYLSAQSEQQPDALAIVHDTERLTYRELEARSNRLAHHLRTLGVRTNVRVGLCLEACADQLVAMFAILKAGGVYVPLDPEYPADRLHYMVEDAVAPVLITRRRFCAGASHGQSYLILIDEDAATIAQYGTSAPLDESARRTWPVSSIHPARRGSRGES